jgi:hypothetical protein
MFKTKKPKKIQVINSRLKNLINKIDDRILTVNRNSKSTDYDETMELLDVLSVLISYMSLDTEASNREKDILYTLIRSIGKEE